MYARSAQKQLGDDGEVSSVGGGVPRRGSETRDDNIIYIILYEPFHDVYTLA